MIVKQMTKLLGTLIRGPDDKGKKNSQTDLRTYDQNKDNTVDITKYETRRHEIAESSLQINGIFFIYKESIIPDYFSEYLASDKNSPKEQESYHGKFFDNYIKHKYPDIPLSDKYLPRGRISVVPNGTVISLDKCYFQNMGMIKKLLELYRITGKINVIWNSNYKCHKCKNTDDGGVSFLSYSVGDLNG